LRDLYLNIEWSRRVSLYARAIYNVGRAIGILGRPISASQQRASGAQRSGGEPRHHDDASRPPEPQAIGRSGGERAVFWEIPISGTRFALAFFLMLALSAGPIFSVALPGMVDYPNHLARMHVLLGADSSILGRYYATRWAPLPNLAMDAIVPLLARVIPLEMAGKLFLVLTFAAVAGGAAWLNRVLHGRWSLWSLSGFLFLYNSMLEWGFVNFLFGLGLALCGLALWLASAAWPPLRRIALSAAVALAVYFSHIVAFGIYLLLLAASEAGPVAALLRHGQWRPAVGRLLVLGAQFVAPAALLALVWLPSAGGEGISYEQPWRKITTLLTVFDSPDHVFQLICTEVFVSILILLAMQGGFRLAPAMRWPLVLAGLAYLALPTQALTGFGADRRMPLVIFLLVLAGSLPRAPDPRIARLVGITLLLLFAARLALVEIRWRDADPAYRADIAALDALPEGAKLAVGFPERALDSAGNAELHLATLAVIRRDAFVPTLFVHPAQQPVALTSAYAALAAASKPGAIWESLVAHPQDPATSLPKPLDSYDFVALVDIAPFRVPPTPCLTPIRSGTSFQLFAINQSCAESS